MGKSKTEIVPDDIYPFHSVCTYDGWARSGFDKRKVEMQVRRVTEPGQPDEVQIEMQITEQKGERHFQHFGGMVLDAEQARKLIDALSTDNDRKDRALRAPLCASAKPAVRVIR